MKIEAKIMGDKEIQRKIELLAKKNNKAVKEVIEKAVIIVEGNAKEKCPVVTNRLRSSITHEVKSIGEKHIGKVGSNVEYAPYVEFGTRPHLAPIGERYMQKYGFKGKFLYVSGAPKPYLYPALKDSRKDIIKLTERAIKKVKV